VADYCKNCIALSLQNCPTEPTIIQFAIEIKRSLQKKCTTLGSIDRDFLGATYLYPHRTETQLNLLKVIE